MRMARKQTLPSVGKRMAGLVAGGARGRGIEETTRACPEGLRGLGCLHEEESKDVVGCEHDHHEACQEQWW